MILRNRQSQTCILTSSARMRKVFIWKVIMITLLVLYTICFAEALSFYYKSDLPSTPQPQLGRIYPLNNHGWITYLTKEESYMRNFLSAMGLLFFILFVAIGWFFDPFNCFANGGRKKT